MNSSMGREMSHTLTELGINDRGQNMDYYNTYTYSPDELYMSIINDECYPFDQMFSGIHPIDLTVNTTNRTVTVCDSCTFEFIMEFDNLEDVYTAQLALSYKLYSNRCKYVPPLDFSKLPTEKAKQYVPNSPTVSDNDYNDANNNDKLIIPDSVEIELTEGNVLIICNDLSSPIAWKIARCTISSKSVVRGDYVDDIYYGRFPLKELNMTGPEVIRWVFMSD